MQFERGKRRSALLDIAPLVDVIFLLLLFFMLTSRMVSEPAIAVDLPDSSTAKVQTPSEIVITLGDHGDLFLGETPVSFEDLVDALKVRLEQEKKTVVHLRADHHVDVGTLIHVVDCVKMSGCSAFSIETKAE